MNTLLGAVNVALFIAIAATLVFKYRQSGQAGFLWLAVPMALLPFLGLFIAEWIQFSVDALVAGEPNAVYPFSLVESGKLSLGSLLSLLNGVSHIAWSSFVLVSMAILLKERSRERVA